MSFQIVWESIAGPLRISGPIGHRLANLAISLRYFRNTMLYVRAAGRAPNYIKPLHYTEKMQCRKLFDRNPIFNVLCDKLDSRNYVEKAGVGLKLPRLYWSGENPDDIPFDQLPEAYVIKPNHRCGAVFFVATGEAVDQTLVRSLCRRWLRSPYGRRLAEWGYRDVRRKVFVEEVLPAAPGASFPDDYKLAMFGGNIAWIEHTHDRDGANHHKTYFDRDWNRLKFLRWRGNVRNVRTPLDGVPPPPTLARMIEAAEHLGKGFDQLRVDMYVVGSDIYFGEFTIYEESGLSVPFPDDEKFVDFPSRDLDREFGAKWEDNVRHTVAAKVGLALIGRETWTRPIR
jgi:hypothetical protein